MSKKKIEERVFDFGTYKVEVFVSEIQNEGYDEPAYLAYQIDEAGGRAHRLNARTDKQSAMSAFNSTVWEQGHLLQIKALSDEHGLKAFFANQQSGMRFRDPNDGLGQAMNRRPGLLPGALVTVYTDKEIPKADVQALYPGWRVWMCVESAEEVLARFKGEGE